MTEQTSNNDPAQTAKITSLKPTMQGSLALTADGLFSNMVRYIKERDLIDLDGDWMADVELIDAQPGEKYVGKLTLFESQMFAIAMLSQEIIQDTMIEAQAQTAEAAARMLRQQKHNQSETDKEQHVILSEDDRLYVNELSCVFHMARAAYEFSARSRFEVFDSFMIIRSGYVAYMANE